MLKYCNHSISICTKEFKMLFLTTKAPAIMAGILLFATVQQSVLHLSTPTPKAESPTAAGKSDPCPELLRQQELLLAHQKKEAESGMQTSSRQMGSATVF